jgi:uncharacterized SAM-binding protein YcdF (DUF218 family)
LAVLVLLAASHALWMTALGKLLIHDDGPAHAEMAVVLAGDFYGNRILRAAELVKQGYVPKVLVSGPHVFYGIYECDAAIPFAVAHGYPQAWFLRAPHEALSTRAEADVILQDLRSLGVHRFLLVTSDFHTGRASRIFRAAGPGFDMRTVAAPDKYFTPTGWWRNREGQKTFFMEWSKTFATMVGL